LPTGARILIVDDNSANRLVLAEILKSWHIETVQADSSQSGAEQVRRAVEQGQPFQAALIDNLMPGGSGFDLVQSLGDQCPPAVLLCSELMREDAVRMRDLGIESWLLKPVRRSELYHILISILGKPRPSAEDKATEAPQEIPILLAEDSAENRALFGYFLKGSGYNPDLAENGLVAVRKFQENQYHMVFMDMQMPELDGYSAILKIREFESANQRRRTPVIALTAFARAEEIAKGFAAGCDFHLAKPIKKTELLATIRRFLPAALRPPVPAEADLPPRSADSAAE
jgi:CheY-like chemotaxis protein